MGFVTVFCPLTTTGVGETLVQAADETRFAVDCNIYLGVSCWIKNLDKSESSNNVTREG
jgi:hypothetical protein